eukprot:jgi/Tetstr1/427019/TSEL_017224.t1
MVHMPAEMSMETAVPIDFQEAWAEAQRCVNERVVAAMEANDPVVLDRALKWKYLLPQLLLRAPSRGGRRRLQSLAWRFRAFAERRMTELVRSWDDARTEAFYAGHARQRRTDADLFAALLVGTADTVVALVEDGELSRAAGRLFSKGMGDLSDPAILAQLRDKHPSRSHPIPDAAYDIPVDEAALTVDMRVPYQQLKQHVAAGPSGMRNEYLRCLVGEYAPASGPAAVRAMSEVASMYLQGRLPGWFNRLFASARLVAPVKKLGEGRAPDVRPVAVGEAERRAAERAVVDNMKEAYVSVLAPSQLGVGFPAGDSVLIHGVRLIAEKLGPRAVIVHTDLRNAYNEAWRRTIIQRHIDCSPLHPVIPALLASLSTDSYLVVDDRSAPLRSEDGVQQGAPLATTSFCVAIHPEVQQCDTTLEVNDGAARFNADDGILVGLPEHVWPALHAFRTSIKASVGLEVRFDKMQAYSADMEAARREAPADIEWPELDGHHGIAVLNVPLGSPEYVQAYMRGKAEELREEVDASLSKLLSAKPSRRYTHALHHHAWALLKHCMQHKAGYWLRNCLPSEVEAFAEAVDATILAAVERVLGVSFDPSTYGTDTNPVVTDFLAELLHDPDPMAAEVATLSEDAVARARSRLHLPTRLKGAGIRRMATVRDAAFIGCMNAILPRFLTKNSGTNTPTPGFFDPQLGSVLGRGSFNANSSARQYDHFLNDAHGSDSYAAEMREAWGRLQAATAGYLGDADARQIEREVEAASGSQKELTAFLDQANNSRLRNEVCALPATCRERILFNQLDAASGMWTVAIPTARTAMTPHELREVAAGYFFLPSPCLAPVVGCQIILPSTEHNPVIVDLYGDALMNLPAPGDAHWRVQHDAIADAFRDHCVHDLGIAVRREVHHVDDLFQQAVPLGNTVPRDELKDLVPDAELSLPAFNVVTGSYDPRSLKSTLLEFKTMRYGVKYTSVPRATAVDRFERSLLGDIQRGLAARDAAWHNTEPGHKGPLRDILDMSEYTGMVFGTVGEVSKGVHRTMSDLEVAAQAAAESMRVMAQLAAGEPLSSSSSQQGSSSEEDGGDSSASSDASSSEREGEVPQAPDVPETTVPGGVEAKEGPAVAAEATPAPTPDAALVVEPAAGPSAMDTVAAEGAAAPPAAKETETDSEEDSDDSSETSDDSSEASLDSPRTAAQKLKTILNASDSDEDAGVGVFSKNEITPAGTVTAMLEGQIVVQAPPDTKPLDEGSVLVLPDRTPVGRIEEIFGPVQQPFYILRYAGTSPEPPPGLKVGAELSAAVTHSTHVMPEKLYVKGYDNSGRDDEETEQVDFSDDEKEAEYKKGLKQKKRKGGGEGRGRGGFASDLDVARQAIGGGEAPGGAAEGEGLAGAALPAGRHSSSSSSSPVMGAEGLSPRRRSRAP